MDKIFQQDLTKEEKVGGIFIRAEALIPAVPLPPRTASFRNERPCSFLNIEFFIRKTQYC